MKKFAITGIFLAVVTSSALAQYDDTDTTITTTTTTTPVTTTGVVTNPVVTTTPAVTTPVLTTTPTAVTTTTPVIERKVIVTPVPTVTADKIVPIPAGYANCFNVAAGWYNDVWVAEHQVCQYNNTGTSTVVTSGNTTGSTNAAIGGSTWVAGYWTCPKYNTSGECTSWVWKPGRWVRTLEVY